MRVAIVGALLVVVAIASQARHRSSAGTVHPTGLRLVGDAVIVLMALVLLAGWVIVAYALMPGGRRRRGRTAEEAPHVVDPPPARWWHKALAAAVALAGQAALAAALVVTARGGPRDRTPIGPAPRPVPGPPGRGAAPGVGGGGGLDWLVIGLVVAGVAASAVVLLVVGRRRAPTAAAPRTPRMSPADSLADVGLHELRREPDPRRAVIQAYTAMEAFLAASGTPRRRSEAPFEFLARALTGLGTSAGAARRLTELFERARFSRHPITEQVRHEAIAAVGAVRGEPVL